MYQGELSRESMATNEYLSNHFCISVLLHGHLGSLLISSGLVKHFIGKIRDPNLDVYFTIG